ncbi:MAG: hypothetical protein J0L82_00440 [Deltaproteobacteria bacterium]|jgi:hypothetical protein|nr:hypothetical protein [Deltaproteobacteria bacterium]
MSDPNFPLFRPSSGQIAILLAATVFLLLVVGCGTPTNPDQDSWKLTPPEIIGTALDGSANKQSVKGQRSNQDKLKFNLESYLKFSKADRGFNLVFETRCDSLFYRGTMVTSEAVSLARMVPPQVLSESPTRAPCLISIEVRNQLGSVHRFQLKNVELAANSTEEKIPTTDELNSRLPSKHEPLRLVCGSWWSEEERDSVNAALSLKTRIQSLVSSAVVSGLDDRQTRFRPVCRLFQLQGDSGITLVTALKLSLPGLETVLSKAIALPPGAHYTFLHKPLIDWSLKNSSQRRQIIFINRPGPHLSMSYANVTKDAPYGWSKMISVPFEFQLHSSQTRFDSAAGIFVELLPGQTLAMQLKLNFDAHCMVSLENRGTPFLRFEMGGRPISYFVLDRDLSMDQIAAGGEQYIKDVLTENRPETIFSSQVIEFGQSSNEIIDGGTFAEAERRIGPGLNLPFTNSSKCFHGQMFAVPEASRRPVVD